MTKQTNEFQQLMHYIYGQMAPEGADVTESALLEERTTGAQREVDILIEAKVVGEMLRIAVECRDRKRKDTIGWIDEIIGKYQNLEVNKIIAVSRSGFSKEATDKAAANGIETRTLKEALETDWPEEFIRVGIAKLTYQPVLAEVRVDTEPAVTDQDEVSGTVIDEQGNAYATLEEVAFDCFERRVKGDTRQYVSQHFPRLFGTLADVKNKALLIEQSLRAPDLYLRDAEGAKRKILRLVFYTLILFTVDKLPVKNYRFHERVQITSSAIDLKTIGAAYSVDIVQVAGEDQGRVFFKPEGDSALDESDLE